MYQKKWTFNSDIANRQNFREPKFPLFSYFSVKREIILKIFNFYKHNLFYIKKH